MTYESVLHKLNLLKIKTKGNKEVDYHNLKKAVEIMIKRYPTCRWKQKSLVGKKQYILSEEFYWLLYVYFQTEKSMIDADNVKISKDGIEWLCKNCFKQKYLELLEECKMELTENYIDEG